MCYLCSLCVSVALSLCEVVAAADGGQAERAVPSLCPRAPPGPGRARASPALQSSASAGAEPETWPPPTTGCPHHETSSYTTSKSEISSTLLLWTHLKDFLLQMHKKHFNKIFKSFFCQVLNQNCTSKLKLIRRLFILSHLDPLLQLSTVHM